MMWAGWFEMCPRDPFPVARPEGVRWAAFGAVLLGFGLAVGSLLQLRGVENIERLVTTGLYSKVRHPMYAGFILWIMGWAMYHGALISLVPGLAGIVSIFYWQRLEEASLELRYGETYRRYRAGTWLAQPHEKAMPRPHQNTSGPKAGCSWAPCAHMLRSGTRHETPLILSTNFLSGNESASSSESLPLSLFSHKPNTPLIKNKSYLSIHLPNTP
jgi:hypothetical protein